MSMHDDKYGLQTSRPGRSGGNDRSRKTTGRIAALLVFGSLAVLITRQEIPGVSNLIDRLFDEPAWQAAEKCRAMARGQTSQPGFSRMERSGKTKKTEDGYYVSGIVISVLDSEVGDHDYYFSCNVTSAGEVVAIHSESVLTDRLNRDN